ncbi:MAG: efflux RND transporter permease subunit [Planctomycetota bacterium]
MTPPRPTSPLFKFFFVKTVFGTLLMATLVAGGVMAYHALVKEAQPNLELGGATVIVAWPGAAPSSVEREVTDRLEKKIKALEGIQMIESSSQRGQALVLVRFRAGAPMGELMQQLRAKVSDAAAEMPDEVQPPRINAASMSAAPVLTFMFYADLDEAMVDRHLRQVKAKLERIPGVNAVQLSGTRREVVRIELKPRRLAALAISPTTIASALRDANQDMPWGRLESPHFTATMVLAGRFESLEALRSLPIKRFDDGRLVRLRDLADVRRDLAAESVRTSVAWRGADFRKSYDLSVTRNPGEDVLTIIDRAKAIVADAVAEPDWPEALTYQVTADDSVKIWNKLDEMFDNGWQAMLAVFVVLLILLNWREALVAGLAIPITFLGALAVLWTVGYSLNEIVIIGMVLALGLLVDDFILMMEGMHEALASGHSIAEGQTRTIRSYAIPSLSGSLTTILAFLPLMLMGGVDGKFIRLIPVTASICLVLSYLCSLFIVVPLSRYILRAHPPAADGEAAGHRSMMDRVSDAAGARLAEMIRTAIVAGKGRAVLTFAIAVGVFLYGATLFGGLPFIMYPKEDGRNLGVTLELGPNAELDETQTVVDAVGEALRQKTYFLSINRYVGMKSPLTSGGVLDENEAPNLGGLTCRFTSFEERGQPAYSYLPEVRATVEEALQRFPAVTYTLKADQGGTSDEAPIQINLAGTDMDGLREVAGQVKNALRNIPGATDVADSLGPPTTLVRWRPDREALDFYNLGEPDMAAQIRYAMAPQTVGKFGAGGGAEDLDIRMGMQYDSRKGTLGGPKNWEEYGLIGVVTPAGERVTASAFLRPQVVDAARAIRHRNGSRGLTITAGAEGGTAGQIIGELLPRLQKLQANWPAGYAFAIGGEVEKSQEVGGSAGKGFVVALFLIFALLCLLFDSFRQPFIIMFSVPFALIGTFYGFTVLQMPISFPALVGIISLAGIAVNDAIVMIETMNEYRRGGKSVRDAAAHGASDRLRPILSTTLTTCVGLIPLGLSSALWKPLCAAVVFGLLAATLVSLLVIPALYVLLTPERAVTTD